MLNLTPSEQHAAARCTPLNPCNHGHYLNDCALCLKRPGECDYGSCTAAATVRVVTPSEQRPMCGRHALIAAMRTPGAAIHS